MGYLLVSINHTTADIAFRAAVALAVDEQHQLFATLQAQCPRCRELVVLSTCNRTELYVWHDAKSDNKAAVHAVWQALAHLKSCSLEAIQQHSMVHTDEAVAVHLVKTSAGFLSMMIGETQIFGQVKKAYAAAVMHEMADKHLHTLFQKSFRLAKSIRTETSVGQDTVSLAAAVAKLCTHIYSAKTKHNLLFVGAGDTIRVTARYVFNIFRSSEYHFCNRTLAHARILAEPMHATVHSLSDLAACVAQADIIICATSHSEMLISADMAQRAVQAGKRLQLYIDLSVPTNIADDIAHIDGVYHYNVDALSRVIDENIQARKAIVHQCDATVAHKVAKLYAALPSHPKQQLICAYRQHYAAHLSDAHPHDATYKKLVHRVSKLLHATDDPATLAHLAEHIAPDEVY